MGKENKIPFKETTSESFNGSEAFIDEYSFFQKATPELYDSEKTNHFLLDEAGVFPEIVPYDEYWKNAKLSFGKTINMQPLTEEEIKEIADSWGNEFKEQK